MRSSNVVSMAQFRNASTRSRVVSMASQGLDVVTPTLFSTDTRYSEDGPEDVQSVPGSESKPAHLSHVFSRAEQMPMIGATPLGDAALASLYRLLNGRKTKIGQTRPMAEVWREQAK